MKKHEDIQQTLIFSDGACIGNPGPGGYGALIVCQGKVLELAGHVKETTNNKMELQSVISALFCTFFVFEPITIFSDSQYVIKGMTQWISGWKKKDWLTAEKKPVANKELWIRLDEISQHQNITWKHISAHQGFPGNERANTLAQSYAQKKNTPLFKGSLDQYSLSLTQLLKTE
jgi:ribonuclease HI